jgi:two-component system, chemotaxis family, chemotaxis protein CheY
MKILIVEDDFTSRVVMQEFLKPYGDCHIAVNGIEAVEAFRLAASQNPPYDLICLDIMMPELGGHEALTQIRTEEEAKGVPPEKAVKIIMTTALSDPKNVMKAFSEQCEAYLVKPVKRDKLVQTLRDLNLIE